MKKNGFTLIELMIVVSVIAIIAAITIPNLLSARLAANETLAVSTLRNISSSQAQFRASGKADVDRDGVGEYGLFRELSGAWAVRNQIDGNNVSGVVLNPPVLSGAFRTFNANSEVSRSGYLFRMFLPGAGGVAVAEVDKYALGAPLDTDLCEKHWCCYAWPGRYLTSGNRTFFVNQTGDIVGTDNPTYSATGAITAANVGSAFKAGGPLANITGLVAIGTRGRDGNIWKQVN